MPIRTGRTKNPIRSRVNDCATASPRSCASEGNGIGRSVAVSALIGVAPFGEVVSPLAPHRSRFLLGRDQIAEAAMVLAAGGAPGEVRGHPRNGRVSVLAC